MVSNILTVLTGTVILTNDCFVARAAASARGVSSESNLPVSTASGGSSFAAEVTAGAILFILRRHPWTSPDGGSILGRLI